VYAAVIKLDSLSDAVWSTTENHDSAALAFPNLIFLSVCGVIVRSIGFELGGTGVDEPVGRQYRFRVPLFPHIRFGAVGQIRDLPIGEAEPFGCA
jgi:hypothetical protein